MKISELPHKQVQHHLKGLQAFKPHRQLLVKVGGGLLADEGAVLELAEALTELTEHGIHILLIHGAGTQISQAVEKSGAEPRFVEGKRYTDETTLELAQKAFNTLSEHLVHVFKVYGIDAVSLPAAELFSAKRDPSLGLVGTGVTDIKTAEIVQSLTKHSVVVLHPLARDDKTGQTLNVNADTVFQALATELRPHRMTSLSPTGGVLKPIDGSDTQELISGIDIRNIEGLIADGTVSGGMALKLRELATILGGLPVGSAISITKPSELLEELLTDEGSGTFVGKGPKIVTRTDIAGVFDDLSVLIEEVFDKALPEDYEDKKFEKIYYTADSKAFGIVTRLSDGTPYLDKLVVSLELQGRGVGENLWYHITADYPKLLWRSHVTNRYATWYHRHADIMQRHSEWIIFGLGVTFEELEARAAEITAIPAMR